MKLDARNDRHDAIGLSRRILGWLRVLNIVYSFGVGVLLVVSLAAPEFLFRALGVGTLGWEPTTLGMRGIMVAGLAGAFIAHRILTGLLLIVESVRSGNPFLLDNVSLLHSIAWLIVGSELLRFLVAALARMASTPAQLLDIGSTFSFTPWIAVPLVFVLARVFERGVHMREDIEARA
jgi:hypothetical protein